MRVASVVGTRPEIIKMAPVLRALAALGIESTLIHTGQHYSFELDEIFFDDLEISAPDHRLQVGSGSDGDQVSKIVEQTSALLREISPDIVLVQGDTNSCLGGAMAAHDEEIPLAHIEAGLRSYDRSMPEELNRRIVDHLADLLFPPTEASRDILLTEGVRANTIYVVGNTVVDELDRHENSIDARPQLLARGFKRRGYAMATVHRRENVEDATRLAAILDGIGRAAERLAIPVLMPLHPRTQQRIGELGLQLHPNVQLIAPLGYREFLGLHANALLMLTDSGGLQEEACCLGVPCVTLRDNTERPESLEVGASVLAGGSNPDRIATLAAELAARPRTWANPFGDGKTGVRIAEILLQLHSQGAPTSAAVHSRPGSAAFH